MATLAQLLDGVIATRFEINDVLSIGRLPQNDVVIDDGSVSSRHARIERRANRDFPEVVECYLVDLGSTNGTELNGNKISGEAQLHHEDTIKIAFHQFKFFDEDAVNLSKTVHILDHD